MNKRITYLLATLLIAESAMPISAQSLNRQTRTYPSINTTYLRTTSEDPTITPSSTTGPSVTVKLDKIYATEIADARAKVDFQLHNIKLKPEYTYQAGSLHIALDSGLALTSITPTGEVTNDHIESPGVLAIYDSTNFTFEFTAKNINPASIRGNSYFTFKIPGYLLTTNIDLEVKVFIEQDTVEEPTVSPDTTTSSAIKIVNLKHNSKYSRILYTLDGSDVTLASNLYKEGTPINVSPSNTLKAVAFIGTMPSEQIVVAFNDIPSVEDSNSDLDGTTKPEDGNSDSNEDSSSNDGSTSNGGSTSNEDKDHSVETDGTTNTDSSTSTTDDSNQSASDTISISDTVSNTVTTLIKQKERNLNTKVTEVQYGLTINNKKVQLENKLLVSSGRTLAPLRTIAEALNIPIYYHAESKTAIIKMADKLIEFPLGYNVAIVNGEMIQIDANDSTILSTIKNGRTYLPLRFIAEQLNLNIHFDGKQVHMSSVK